MPWLKASTGLRNQLLDTAPFHDIFDESFIEIYAGDVPEYADDSIGSATLLCTISNASGATGLTFEETAVDGVISKLSTETWSGTNVATGTASFYRLVTDGDPGTASTTEPRIQGTVGTGGADMNLSSVSLTSAATQTIDFFTVTLPTY